MDDVDSRRALRTELLVLRGKTTRACAMVTTLALLGTHTAADLSSGDQGLAIGLVVLNGVLSVLAASFFKIRCDVEGMLRKLED